MTVSACAGTIDGSPGLPALQARAVGRPQAAGQRLRDRPSSTTHASPGYMYDLVRYWADGVPDRRHRRRHRQVRGGPGRALQRDGQHQRRRPARGRGAGRLGARARRRRQHRPGPAGSLPDHRDALRVHRCGVGADGRRAGRRVRRRVRPAVRAAQDVRGRQHARTTPGSAARSAPASRRCPSVTNGSPPPMREGDELFLSHGRVHRRGRAPGATPTSSATSSAARSTPTTSCVLDMFASVFMNTDGPRRQAPLPGGHRHPAREPVLAAVDPGQDRVGLRLRHPEGLRATSCRCSASTTGCRCRRPTARRPGKFAFTVAFAMPNGVDDPAGGQTDRAAVLGRRQDLVARHGPGAPAPRARSTWPTGPAARRACGSRPPTPPAGR